MLMEDVLPVAHHSSMFLQANHVSLMDACNILLEDALNAINHMLFFTTAANYLIALFPVTENAFNVILITSSPPMESASLRMSSVIRWMSTVPASSA